MRRWTAVWVAALLPLGAVPALAAEPPSSLGIGLGAVDPEGVETTLWLTANYRFHLSRRFALEPEVGYWKKSEQALGITGSVKDLNFGITALGVFEASRRVDLFVGAGAGIHNITGDIGIAGQGSVSDSITRMGTHVLGGVDLAASNSLRVFLNVRHDLVLVEDDEPELDQTKFYGGFRFRF
jgi:opacity protein-like surface antigen